MSTTDNANMNSDQNPNPSPNHDTIDTDTSEISDISDADENNIMNSDINANTNKVASHDFTQNLNHTHVKIPAINFVSNETPLNKMMKSVNNREEEFIILKLQSQLDQNKITKLYAVEHMMNYIKLLGTHERKFEKLEVFMNELDPTSSIRNGTYADKELYKYYAIYCLVGYIFACIIRYYVLKLVGYD
jgi:hypothetical protein